MFIRVKLVGIVRGYSGVREEVPGVQRSVLSAVLLALFLRVPTALQALRQIAATEDVICAISLNPVMKAIR
jgi:hypothetical protein